MSRTKHVPTVFGTTRTVEREVVDGHELTLVEVIETGERFVTVKDLNHNIPYTPTELGDMINEQFKNVLL